MRLRRLLSVGFVVPVSVTSALLMGLAHSAADVGLSPVTIDCGDAAPISGGVDLNTLANLEASMQAMLDNPSGMSCTLTQPTALDPASNSNDPGSFVVGGGRYFAPGTSCAINFGMSGHVDKNGVAHGTQTATESNSTQECGGQGHIKANVTCVAVNGNLAEIRGNIMEQSGSLGPQFFPPGDTVMVTDVQDNGNPSSGVPDRIQQGVAPAGSENACAANVASPAFTVDRGNVTVHNG